VLADKSRCFVSLERRLERGTLARGHGYRPALQCAHLQFAWPGISEMDIDPQAVWNHRAGKPGRRIGGTNNADRGERAVDLVR
jgi:hypothetical protein